MRITDGIMYRLFLSQLQDLNADFATANEQVTTGKRLNRPSDDPVDFTTLSALKAEYANTDQYTSNLKNADSRMENTDGRLNDVTNIMIRVISLVEEAANEPTVGQPRKGIAKEIESIMAQLQDYSDSQVSGRALFAGTRNTTDSLKNITNNSEGRVYSIANTTVALNGVSSGVITTAIPDVRDYDGHVMHINILDAAGNYEIVDLDNNDAVIASGTFAAPGDSVHVDGITFTYNGGANAGDVFTVLPQYSYNGTNDDIQMQVDENTYVIQNIKGPDVFGGTEPTSSGTQQPGGTIFDDLAQLRLALLTDDQTAIQSNITTMRDWFNNLEQNRAMLGGRISNVQGLITRTESELADTKINISNIENANLPEVLTNLVQTQTAMSAALQAGSQINGRSLFDYIG